LGGYLKQCDSCGQLEVAYCACKDRHCPNCGHFEKAQWLEKQKAVLLPAPYFQVVFTIDHVFNPLVWRNKKVMYDLLFQISAQLLKAYGEKYLGGKIGFTTVLHTWGQLMQAHPHAHCMVGGGALIQTKNGARWRPANRKFLFDVKKLSRDFRKAFCQGICKLHKRGKLAWDEAKMGSSIEELITTAMSQKWEVYIQRPPNTVDNGSPETLADYLISQVSEFRESIQQIDAKTRTDVRARRLERVAELKTRLGNYKGLLQASAERVGKVLQDAEAELLQRISPPTEPAADAS